MTEEASRDTQPCQCGHAIGCHRLLCGKCSSCSCQRFAPSPSLPTEQEEEIASLRKQLAARIENADFLRKSVGACHLMISRNDLSELSKDKWDTTDLPPRLLEWISSRAALPTEAPRVEEQLIDELSQIAAFLVGNGDVAELAARRIRRIMAHAQQSSVVGSEPRE